MGVRVAINYTNFFFKKYFFFVSNFYGFCWVSVLFHCIDLLLQGQNCEDG